MKKMKIVLAVDGSDFSKAAMNELASMPLPSKTEVCILNVYENPLLATRGALSMGGGMGDYYEEAEANARNSAENIVNEAAETLKDQNDVLTITTDVIRGTPKNAILEKAKSFDADLIVVGSQGHGAFARFLLGSVSQSVAMHAECSVLIIRKK